MKTTPTRRPTAARPSCAKCTESLSELLRAEGIEHAEAKTIAAGKALMVRIGDGYACPRCTESRTGDRLAELAPNRAERRRRYDVKAIRRKPIFTAEFAASLAETQRQQAERKRVREERRAAARAARGEA